jgi:hypothetical protein
LNGGRVSLLFSDYDGTLSPLDVTREESRLSPSLDAVLRGIASKAKLAVVTSKSFDFISVRIPYAHAWGCIAGLDVRFADGQEFAVSPDLDVEAALEKTKAMLDGEGVGGLAGLLGRLARAPRSGGDVPGGRGHEERRPLRSSRTLRAVRRLPLLSAQQGSRRLPYQEHAWRLWRRPFHGGFSHRQPSLPGSRHPGWDRPRPVARSPRVRVRRESTRRRAISQSSL